MAEIEIPPGIVKSSTEAAATGRFVDAQWVRFVAGKAQNIGGWTTMNSTAMTGVPRAAHAYLAPSGLEVRAFGTERKLYAMSLEHVLTNITPIRASSTINNNPFATTDGSPIVTVTDTAHGAITGDTVNISGAAAVGGITPSGDYLVTVINANSYTITHSSNATSTVAAGGGASVVAAYEISIGSVDPAHSGGYGVGDYGEEDYGDERDTSFVLLDSRFWSLDNYGNELLAAYQGGTIYLYNQDTDTRAEALTNAPTDVRFAFVTEERFIMALCADMYVKWPDRDDPTIWTAAETNTANTRRLAAGSKLVAGAVLGQNLSVIWTDRSVYALQFTGSDFVYDTQLIGDDCGLAGPGAFCTFNSMAFWMSHHDFHMLAGGVLPIPNSDDVASYVFGRLNEDMHAKTVCFYNANFREVWWIYPSTTDEPDSYVAVNVDDFHWTTGSLPRVGIGMEIAAAGRPFMTTSTGYAFMHEQETATDHASANIAWELETGLWRIPGAERSLDIFGLSPDFDTITGTVTLTATGKDRPQSSDSDTETASITSTTEMADFRLHGRYFSYALTGAGNFREGTHVLEVQPAGYRR